MTTKNPRRLRKPLPPAYPLAERFLDVDAMIEAGDLDAEVWLPGEVWAELLKAAQDEQAAHERGGDARRADANAAELSALRTDLAKALGAGVDTELADLVEIAKGYAMALDFEREQAIGKLELARAKGPMTREGTPLSSPEFDPLFGTSQVRSPGEQMFTDGVCSLCNLNSLYHDMDKPPGCPGPCKHCGETDHPTEICGLAPSTEIEDEEAAPVRAPTPPPPGVVATFAQGRTEAQAAAEAAGGRLSGPTILETAQKNDEEEAAREIYCRSCRKWFPHGTHAPHTKAKSAQAELSQS